jgi:hypothetical protein
MYRKSVLMAKADEGQGTAKAAESSKPEYQPLADMTMKKMGCDPKDAIRANDGKGGNVYMCRIFGEATEAKKKEAKGGNVYTYLMGVFRGVTPTGAKFESTKLFLPGRLIEEIESALKASNGGAVTFGYDIYSTVDADSSVGYKYAAQSLVKTEAQDRVKELSKNIEAKPLPKGDTVSK